MKQLYLIGILLAIVLLVLLGLTKLRERPGEVIGNESTPRSEAPGDVASDEQPSSTNTASMVSATSSESTTTMTTTVENTRITLKTTKGDITLELYTKDMPITAGNFLKLAESDFYDGVKFHRVIDGFMIQGGDPLTKDGALQGRWGTGGPGYAIEDEFVKGLSNVRGTISMANSGPNSGGSQFFINLVDNTGLDFDKPPFTSKHPVFGKVVAGMDIVDTIGKTPTGAGNVPTVPVVINDIVVTEAR